MRKYCNSYNDKLFKNSTSLFGSLRDDSKSEKTFMWHLLIMVEKQEKKTNPSEY